MSKVSAVSAARLKFAYLDEDDRDYRTVEFVVAVEGLWSAEGLAALFTDCRKSFLVNPGDPNFDRKSEDAWGSWHLVGVEETDAFLVVPDTPGVSV